MFRKAFWDERFFAWLVDMLIVGISLGIIGIFSWLTGQSFNWWTIWSGWAPLLNINIGGITYFLYWLIMDGLFGQSFGKMVIGLKVTSIGWRVNRIKKCSFGKFGKSLFAPSGLSSWLDIISFENAKNL